MCHLKIFTLKPQPPNVIVQGGGTFGKELRLNEVREWGPHDGISAVATRPSQEACSLSVSTSEDSEKATVCEPGRDPSPEKRIDTLILNFWASRTRRNQFLLFKRPGHRIFVVEAQVDKCTSTFMFLLYSISRVHFLQNNLFLNIDFQRLPKNMRIFIFNQYC